MKKQATDECSNLNIEFIKNLKNNELLFNSIFSLSLAYATIAEFQQQRGYSKAKKYAQMLALKHFSEASPLQMVKTIKVLLKVNTFTYLCFMFHPVLFKFRKWLVK